MATIDLKNLTKTYVDVEVIPSLDLHIRDGEFVVLVGPSGCGKTTTLRMIAGLETATSGQVFIGGEEVTELRPGLRNCAMVFQNYALYPHMNVAQNIGFGMRVRGTDKAKAKAAVAKAAQTLNLEEFLTRKPGALSGGQRQRVAIGRAIVRDPKVFLFDEPLSNLDAKLRVEMRIEIKQLHRRLKTTIVYVTHDQVEAMTMADRVVVMNAGVIEQVADPITLYEYPDNLFVATFIGAPSMNLIHGVLQSDAAGLVFNTVSGQTLPVPDQFAAALQAVVGEEIVLGIRPEHTGESPELGPGLTLEIVDIEPLGPHTLAVGTTGSEKFTAQVSASTSARPGDALPVYLDRSKIHFFRQSTGQVLR